MAKATLPTNYQDDVLKSSMNGKRRYSITDNSDGTKCLDDVTQYDKVGSNFGAADMNKTNAAVNAAADASKIMDNVDDIAANTQAGYMMGALAGKQLISNLDGAKIIHEGSGADVKYYAQLGADAASKKLLGNTPCSLKMWTGGNGGEQSIDISITDYPEYRKLTIDSLKAGIASLSGAMGQGGVHGIKAYNASTGVVTISYYNHGSATLTGFLVISLAGFLDL